MNASQTYPCHSFLFQVLFFFVHLTNLQQSIGNFIICPPRSGNRNSGKIVLFSMKKKRMSITSGDDVSALDDISENIW